MSSPRTRRRRWWNRPNLLALLIAAGLAPVLLRSSTVLARRQEPAPPSPAAPGTATLSGFEPLRTPPEGAQRVEIGIYLNTVFNIDQKSNTFYADMYMWFLWTGDKDPSETVEIVNAVDEWGFVNTPVYKEPKRLPDGRMFQQIHLEGRFFHPFALDRYPFDVHDLTILVEDTTYTVGEIYYEADREQSGLGQLLSIPGWEIAGWEMDSLVRRYDTTFGDPSAVLADQFSHLRFDLRIVRPPSFFIWKLFLPLLLVHILCWSRLLIDPEEIDVRCAVPPAALLTAVFLQLSYSSGLPELGELVLMDKIYVLTYVLIVAALVEVILTAKLVHNDQENGVRRARRVDRFSLILEVLVFSSGTAFVILYG